MSAPSFLDFTPRHAAPSSEVLAAPSQRVPVAADGHCFAGAERRATDPVSLLSREQDDLCATAVDADEIAAGLEASGLSDGRVQQAYGLDDVFQLADQLFRRVPRRLPPLDRSIPNPWTVKPMRLVVRGLIFALPGLMYVALSGVGAGASSEVALVLGLSVGWATSQALAYLGHALMGRRAAAASRALLFRVLIAIVIVTELVAQVTVASGRSTTLVVALAGGQVVYMCAAAALLVVGGEQAIVISLSPGVVAAIAVVAFGDRVPDAAAAAAVALSLALTVSCALWMTRPRSRTAVRLRDRLTGSDLATASWHGTYGFLCAALVSLPVLMRGSVPLGAVGLAVVPLVWSMGVAEWQVFRFRGDTHDLLQQVGTLNAFAKRARRAAAISVGGYLAILVASSVAFYALVRTLFPTLTRTDLVSAFAVYDLVAAALLIALMLNICGAVRQVVATLVVVLVATGLTVWATGRVGLAEAAVAITVLVLALTWVAWGPLGDATRLV